MSDPRYLVTARKYRPQRFAELVSQDHVTGTLRNAVRLNRLAHAYLFAGPRGVGKTTAARILAKAINCTGTDDEKGEAGEPCRQCESCRSFEEGRNLNILELDAASNNKVDDVRELRDTVRIPPQGNRKKVYIVDEVHMLSTAAFNALLKTLEEPPDHALFIFATTEPHKVLPTIQSRCQRFDFRRIPIADTLDRLQAICAEESVQADDGSLMLIARKGDGALRDALSVFDQAVSLCGDTITHAALVEALGVVDEDLYFRVTDCVHRGDTAGMLGIVEHIVSSGYDLQEFVDGLSEHLRNLLVSVTLPDSDLIEASEATRKRLREIATDFTEARLLRLLMLADEAEGLLRISRQPRFRLELTLLRMASLPRAVDIREALRRLDDLGVSTDRPGDPPAPAERKNDDGDRPRPAKAAAPERPETRPARKAAPLPAPAIPLDMERKTPVAEHDDGPADRDIVEAVPGSQPLADVADLDDPQDRDAGDLSVPPDPPEPIPGPSLFDLSEAGPDRGTESGFGRALGQPALVIDTPKSTEGSESAPDASAVAVSTAVDEYDATRPGPVFWDAFVEQVKQDRIHVGALLKHAQPTLTDDGTLIIRVPDVFHIRVLRDEKSALDTALENVAGGSVGSLRVVVGSDSSDDAALDADVGDPQATVRRLCEEYPALQRLMERFGGEIVW